MKRPCLYAVPWYARHAVTPSGYWCKLVERECRVEDVEECEHRVSVKLDSWIAEGRR